MNHVNRIGRALGLALLLLSASQVRADGLLLGAGAGVGSAFGQTYYEVGGRLGYDVGLGLTPEVGVSLWRGASPGFVEVSPGLTWYLPVPFIRPYVGGFYAHDFLDAGLPDQDALGLRGGVGLMGVGPVSIDIGVAWERRLSCSVDCDTWWPEISAGLRF